MPQVESNVKRPPMLEVRSCIPVTPKCPGLPKFSKLVSAPQPLSRTSNAKLLPYLIDISRVVPPECWHALRIASSPMRNTSPRRIACRGRGNLLTETEICIESGAYASATRKRAAARSSVSDSEWRSESSAARPSTVARSNHWERRANAIWVRLESLTNVWA